MFTVKYAAQRRTHEVGVPTLVEAMDLCNKLAARRIHAQVVNGRLLYDNARNKIDEKIGFALGHMPACGQLSQQAGL